MKDKLISRISSLMAAVMIISFAAVSGINNNRVYAATSDSSGNESSSRKYYEREELNNAFGGKTIGLTTGSVFDLLAEKYIPDSKIEYINVTTDMAVSLDTEKIDAYIADEPIVRLILNEYTDQYICAALQDVSYGFVYNKSSERANEIRLQMDDFLGEIKGNGILEEIDSIWFGSNETVKKVDFSGLTGENGEINLAISSDVGAPFAYVNYGEYAGYEVDIIARFCRKYGYSLKISDSNLSGMLASVTSGHADIGASCIVMSDERKESMNFSIPDYEGSIVLVTLDRDETKRLKITDESEYERLRGCRIGGCTGTLCDQISEEHIPDCEVVLLNTNADLPLALKEGKIDAYMTDQPIARVMLKEYTDQKIFAVVRNDSYGFIFQKDTNKGKLLCAQMNGFLKEIKENGVIDEIDSIWFGDDESVKNVDYSNLSAQNGTLKFAVSSATGIPFCYLKDGVYQGYDVDMAVRFCREYGYGIEISDYNFAGLLASVSTGKCDFGASCITITDERSESMLFSDSNYDGGIVIVTSDSYKGTNLSKSNAFINSIKEGFEKTFVREDRWKLFVEGIGVTLLITAVSAVAGTVIGFLVFLVYRKKIKPLNLSIDAFNDILEKTPVVVILMILYYLIFSDSAFNGIWVSCVGFTFIFAGTVNGLLKVAVNAVPYGQMEAALSLGYSDTRAFVRMILPQAMQHFLPNYKSEIVSLIKGTAIVGYIAVQDLTKICDIVRSRTYEAFFPIIASAVIYFVLAWILTLLVSCIQFKANPKKRNRKQILKGALKDDRT